MIDKEPLDTKEGKLALFLYSLGFYKKLSNKEADELLKIAQECSEIAGIYPIHIPSNKEQHIIKNYNEKEKLTNLQVLALFITSLYLFCRKADIDPIPIENDFPFIKDIEKMANVSNTNQMEYKYFEDTDTLYIKLVENPSIESEEVDEGIVFDYDENGLIVGIEIENFIKRMKDKKHKWNLL